MKPTTSKQLSIISSIAIMLIYFLIIANSGNAQPDEDCGFGLRLDRLQKFGETMARPTLSGPVVNINTTNFKIHYTLSGTDATTAAWAESVAVYAEYCWSTLSNLGWALPPPDGGIGGDNRYDIYIRNTVALGYYGSTNPESPYSTPYPDGYTSWIDVHKDSITQPFPKFARLRALVAHEFHHACQLRYSWSEQIWFYENTSVYIEDVIYDDVNTLVFRFTQGVDPLDSPHFPITSTNWPYHYTGAIWPTFLHERYNSTIPRRAWERMGSVSGENTLSGINWALVNYGSSNLTSALKEYAVWRYFTGTRSDGFHFSEANLWPISTVLRTHSTYPASGNQSPSNPSGPGGASFIIFTNGTCSLDLSFDGQDGYTWGAYAIGYRAPSASTKSEIILNANGYGTITISWSGNNHIVLVPIVTQWTSAATNLTYTYTGTLPPLVSVTFTNKIRGSNAGGLLLLNGIDTVVSGNSRNLPQACTHHIRTLNERFVSDSIYKHNNWNRIVSEFMLGRNFTVQPNTPQDANFIGLNPVTIRNELIDAPSLNGGSVDFRDPWYLHDASGNQYNRFDPFPSPYRPTGAYNQTTGGVFLNQGLDWQPPYYSVPVPQSQIIYSKAMCFGFLLTRLFKNISREGAKVTELHSVSFTEFYFILTP